MVSNLAKDPGYTSTTNFDLHGIADVIRIRFWRRGLGRLVFHACRESEVQTDRFEIDADCRPSNKRAGKGNEAVRVSGVGFSSSSLSLLLGSLHVWAEWDCS